MDDMQKYSYLKLYPKGRPTKYSPKRSRHTAYPASTMQRWADKHYGQFGFVFAYERLKKKAAPYLDLPDLCGKE